MRKGLLVFGMEQVSPAPVWAREVLLPFCLLYFCVILYIVFKSPAHKLHTQKVMNSLPNIAGIQKMLFKWSLWKARLMSMQVWTKQVRLTDSFQASLTQIDPRLAQQRFF